MGFSPSAAILVASDWHILVPFESRLPFRTGSSSAAGSPPRGSVFYLLIIIGLLLMLAGWMTHIGVCILSGYWWFLMFGLFIFPVGVLNGWYIWIVGL